MKSNTLFCSFIIAAIFAVLFIQQSKGECEAPTLSDETRVIVSPDQNTYSDWSYIQLTCDEMYSPSGSDYSYCDPQTGWDPDPSSFFCYDGCTAPSLPSNTIQFPIGESYSSTQESYDHNDIIVYECAEGLDGTLVGPDQATCINGVWEPSLEPYCTGYTTDAPINETSTSSPTPTRLTRLTDSFTATQGSGSTSGVTQTTGSSSIRTNILSTLRDEPVSDFSTHTTRGSPFMSTDLAEVTDFFENTTDLPLHSSATDEINHPTAFTSETTMTTWVPDSTAHLSGTTGSPAVSTDFLSTTELHQTTPDLPLYNHTTDVDEPSSEATTSEITTLLPENTSYLDGTIVQSTLRTDLSDVTEFESTTAEPSSHMPTTTPDEMHSTTESPTLEIALTTLIPETTRYLEAKTDYPDMTEIVTDLTSERSDTENPTPNNVVTTDTNSTDFITASTMSNTVMTETVTATAVDSTHPTNQFISNTFDTTEIFDTTQKMFSGSATMPLESETRTTPQSVTQGDETTELQNSLQTTLETDYEYITTDENTTNAITPSSSPGATTNSQSSTTETVTDEIGVSSSNSLIPITEHFFTTELVSSDSTTAKLTESPGAAPESSTNMLTTPPLDMVTTFLSTTDEGFQTTYLRTSDGTGSTAHTVSDFTENMTTFSPLSTEITNGDLRTSDGEGTNTPDTSTARVYTEETHSTELPVSEMVTDIDMTSTSTVSTTTKQDSIISTSTHLTGTTNEISTPLTEIIGTSRLMESTPQNGLTSYYTTVPGKVTTVKPTEPRKTESPKTTKQYSSGPSTSAITATGRLLSFLLF
ncbi:serine-rich adhesin for platelets-like [Lytechinus variegatus]|uniref:serine-rich adhesin for platelets-like n=1 Tax=Lytechinus variegatus TaxID=7654 RepID=UPI001BB2042A|nr:serine-rich adhesin for platelets-like [Lytechinus variegatus]